MSPEQARGERLGAPSDVFSVGVVLYEALSGAVPFPDRRTARTAWSFDAGPAMARLRRVAPEALCALVERCLSPEPAQRYEDGASVSRALARLDAGASARSAWPWKALAGVLAGVVVVGAAARHATKAAPRGASAPALKRLTANIPERPIENAALSPDGETLAFVDATGLSFERIGGGPVHVDLPIPGAPQIAAWFPDGERLVVCTLDKGAGAQELWVVSRAGNTPPRRLARGAFTGLAVSPDGARVGFAANDKVGWLPVSEGTDPPPRTLATHEGCFVTEVAWSPDGGRLAYARLCFDSLAQTAIETVATSGGPPVVAVADPHLYNSFVRAAGVVWTPAGDILYPRTEWLPAEPGSNVWAVRVDPRTGSPTAAPRAVTAWTGVGAAALTADRSGSRLAFLRFKTQADVYVGDLGDGGRRLGAPRRLTLSDRNERPSAWSADGQRVFFFSDASGNFDVVSQALDGSPPRPFAAEPDWETSSQLSPDGESLLYWRFPAAVTTDQAVRPEIVRRPLAGGPPEHVLTAETLTHPAGAGRPAPWEARMRCPKTAGAACVLGEVRDEALVFFAFDAQRGRGEEVHRIAHATAASQIWDVSPDGTLLAIPSADGAVLLQPIHGERVPAQVSIPGCDPVTPAWSADGRGLFVSVDCNADDGPFRLYYVSVDGEASLLWRDPSLYILEPEPSPDGKHLAIAVKHTDDDVWMLDGVPRPAP
jgi:Tol biopolymer transport system component